MSEVSTEDIVIMDDEVEGSIEDSTEKYVEPIKDNIKDLETSTLNSINPGSEKLKKSSEEAIQNYADIGIKGVEDKFKSGKITGAEAGKEVAHVVVTAKALEDTEENKDFNKKFKDVKQEELIASAKAELFKEEANKIAAKQMKAEAVYMSFRPILEFDLDHLLVKNPAKRPKYKKVLNKDTGKYEKVLIDEGEIPPIEKIKHTYSERSYGIPLMIFMLIFLTLPYFICTVILSVFSAINYVFVAISRFSRPAFYICATIAGIAILGLFLYVAILCIEGAFNVSIIPENLL